MFDKQGFTLIELLVSLSVVMLMAGIAIPRYNVLRRRSALLSSSYELSQRLREAQELSLSGGEVETGGGFTEVPAGYGIYIDINNPQRYILYADLRPANQKFDGEPDDKIINTVEVGKKAVVSKLTDGSNEFSEMSINFEAPEPETTMKNGGLSLSNVAVNLIAKGTDYMSSVRVNKAGLIYVE